MEEQSLSSQWGTSPGQGILGARAGGDAGMSGISWGLLSLATAEGRQSSVSTTHSYTL